MAFHVAGSFWIIWLYFFASKSFVWYIKVAQVVNLKLVFTDCFYILVVLIKLCKIQYLSYGRPLLFPRNQLFCQKNLKLWRAPTTKEFNIFCWNFAHVFYLVMSTKGWVEFFFILLYRSWVINKSVKNKCVETKSF